MAGNITQEAFTLSSREGEKLRADIRYVKTGEPKPVILFLHGFKGFKDWGAFPAVREYLALAGFVSIGFNFSHNGIGEDLQTFTELDRFSHNTFSLELQEIEDVLGILISTHDVPIEPQEIIPDRVG